MDQSEHLPKQSRKPPVPIVAIGASAGGLEAVSDLLQHLSPTTGLAYVYIQHLSPTHQSQLSDILSQKTAMLVREAKNRMRVEANHVYIIPPNKDMEVVDGMLKLAPRQPEPAIHLPIDQFFVSLAERQRAASIAIVLSGTANDGTLGLKAIKAAGGITFTQDKSAKFQGMPKSAQAEGVVDKVLSPKEIAQELEWLSHQRILFQQTALAGVLEEAQSSAEISTDSDELITLLQLLRKIIGVDFSHYKMATIRRRVVRRMALYKLPALPAYTDYLRQHPPEAGLLYNDLLINVTSFFRDIETMNYLGKVLLPQLIKAKPAKEPFRLWVTACSTGEEVYSLAMLLMEALDEQEKPIPIQIFATDLSERVIGRARLGRYSANQMADVSPTRLHRFFSKEEEEYRISKVIRDLCVFAPHNVFTDPPFSRIDLISCRNLLIYTDNVLQRKAIATFHYALNTTGYLMLGKAETVGASMSLFTQVAKNYKIYARKNNGSRLVMPMVGHTYAGDHMPAPKPYDLSPPAFPIPDHPITNGQKTPPNWAEGKKRETTQNRIMQTPGHPDDFDQRVDELLKQYTPASVVVNKDLDILRFRGSTSLFLEPTAGKANFNLLKMVRPELVFDVRNAVSKAHKSGQPVSKTGLQMQVRGQMYHVTIHAVPFQSQNQEPFILILFEEVTPIALPTTAPAQLRNQRILQLEIEWYHTGEGHDRWLDMAISKINDELLVTFTDFTELKQLQQELEKSVADLRRSNASLEQFAYVASHNLQEPLRKIQQFGNIIQTNYASSLGEEGADLISRMHSASTRLQVLIKDVLAYSRLSAKREAFQPVDLNALVEGVLADLETAITEQKALINVDSLPTIKGDQAQLRQLFQNLISNALKFVTPDRTPQIRISSRSVRGHESGFTLPPTDKNQSFVLIEVTDNGIGFLPDQVERIFQVFQRLHGKKPYAGTGIGLAIVQKVVENHQGYITAEGRPNEGATFRILLRVGM